MLLRRMKGWWTTQSHKHPTARVSWAKVKITTLRGWLLPSTEWEKFSWTGKHLIRGDSKKGVRQKNWPFLKTTLQPKLS